MIDTSIEEIGKASLTTPLNFMAQYIFDGLFDRGHRMSVKDYEVIKERLKVLMPCLTDEFQVNTPTP